MSRLYFLGLALAMVIINAIAGLYSYYSDRDKADKIDVLQQTANKISSQLAPFQEFAKKLYPNLPPSEALEKLQSQMHQLETRTSTLEKKTIPRNLTPEQKAQLIRNLSSYRGHNIHIAEVWSDNEAMHFAEAFKEVFEQAGWKIHITQGLYPSPQFGIILGVKEANDEDGIIIYNALQGVGLQVETKLNKDPNSNNEVVLIIGSKKQ